MIYSSATYSRIREAMEVVRKNFLDGDEFPHTPAEINNGFCADFATIVAEMVPHVQVLSDEDMGPYEYTHIEYGGRYYDAECLEGVEDWTLLLIFQRD